MTITIDDFQKNHIQSLWQLHKDTEDVARALGVTEQTAINRLKKADIFPPSYMEKKERRTNRYMEQIVPHILPPIIWMKPERSHTLEKYYHAYNHSREETMIVVMSDRLKIGWKFPLAMKENADRVLLVGLNSQRKPQFAFYIPSSLLRMKAIRIEDPDTCRFANYRVEMPEYDFPAATY